MVIQWFNLLAKGISHTFFLKNRMLPVKRLTFIGYRSIELVFSPFRACFLGTKEMIKKIRRVNAEFYCKFAGVARKSQRYTPRLP